MSRRGHDDEQMLGHDAFMDVVANMVGVLIILVVVLGGQTQGLTERIKQEVEQSYATATASISPPAQEAASQVENDIARLQQQSASYDQVLASRRQERSAILAVLTQAKEQWERHQADMEDEARRASELAGERRDLLSAVHQLELVSQQKREPLQDVVAIEHLPTPMAQTVFGEELHFRLKEGRLAAVPLEPLMDAIKLDFKRLLTGSLREGERGGTVGPIRDFTATYRMGTSRGNISRGGQVSTAVKVELLGLTLEPVREPLGESLAESLAENSQLAYELAGRDPRTTTVTIWVYPDSFSEFRKIKEHLYRLGYATAARPLPEGRPISGSPNGSRSNSQ